MMRQLRHNVLRNFVAQLVRQTTWRPMAEDELYGIWKEEF